MTRPRAALLALAVLLGAGGLWLGAGRAGAQSVTFVPHGDVRIRLEPGLEKDRRGRPVVTGYVYNSFGIPIERVQLLVETLDAAGQVVDRSPGFVHGVVVGNDRAAFEVPVKTPGESYRISITSFAYYSGTIR